MNPICCHCRTEMCCLKNSFRVAHFSYPNHQRSAEKYGCVKCGAEVITGFSKGFESEAPADLLMYDVWVET